jgi:hypothetical protein
MAQSLAGSGNLVTITGQQPNVKSDGHQSSAVVYGSGGNGGAKAGANGGDLLSGKGAQKSVATPSAVQSSGLHPGSHNGSLVVEAAPENQANPRDGLLARAIVGAANGGQPSTTYRQVDVKPNH